MAAKYDLYETPVPYGLDKKKQLHARVVTGKTVDSKALAELIHSRSSLTKGDIAAVITSLKEVIVEKLREGERIHIDGIGYFQMTVSCPPVDSKKELRAESVQFKSVSFRPQKELKQELSTTDFVRAKYQKHSLKTDSKQIDHILTGHFAEHAYVTCTEFQKMCFLTRTTANRLIKLLAEQGKLVLEGIYHSPIYTPAPGFYGNPKATL